MAQAITRTDREHEKRWFVRWIDLLVHGYEEIGKGMYRINVAPIIVIATALTLGSVFTRYGKNPVVAFLIALGVELCYSQALHAVREAPKWVQRIVPILSSTVLFVAIFVLYWVYYDEMSAWIRFSFSLVVPGMIAVNTLTRIRALKKKDGVTVAQLEQEVSVLRTEREMLTAQLGEQDAEIERLTASLKQAGTTPDVATLWEAFMAKGKLSKTSKIHAKRIGEAFLQFIG